MNYYETLGVPENAPLPQIRKAFRNKAKEYHPDTYKGPDAKFKEVHKAWEVLKDTRKRADYDAKLRASKMDLQPPVTTKPNTGDATSYARPVETSPVMEYEYATFVERFFGHMVDWLIIDGITFFVTIFLYSNMNSLDSIWTFHAWAFFIGMIYYAKLGSSPQQSTWGQRMFGMYITDEKFRRISFAQAVYRYVFQWVSTLLLFAGFIAAIFNDKVQTWHDTVAKTVVVK